MLLIAPLSWHIYWMPDVTYSLSFQKRGSPHTCVSTFSVVTKAFLLSSHPPTWLQSHERGYFATPRRKHSQFHYLIGHGDSGYVTLQDAIDARARRGARKITVSGTRTNQVKYSRQNITANTPGVQAHTIPSLSPPRGPKLLLSKPSIQPLTQTDPAPG